MCGVEARQGSPGGDVSGLGMGRLLATGSLAAALVMNGLANRLPLGGRTTGELSDLYPNLFVPAGATFSIWGIIYALLLAWTVAQFLPGSSALGRRLALPFALSSILNGVWLIAWHNTLVGLSVLIMLGLLAVLLRINVLIAEAQTFGGEEPARRSLLPRAAFGVYLGWVLVAMLANITALLVATGWDGSSGATWAVVLVVVGAGVAIVTLARIRNPFVGAAVVWAFGGIALNRWDDVPAIAWTAVAMMVVVGIASVALVRVGRDSRGGRPDRPEGRRPNRGPGSARP
jgi:translocator protein